MATRTTSFYFVMSEFYKTSTMKFEVEQSTNEYQDSQNNKWQKGKHSKP